MNHIDELSKYYEIWKKELASDRILKFCIS
jgi:hypothetical protein